MIGIQWLCFYSGLEGAVEMLLKNMVDVNVVNKDGNSALSLATYKGNVNCRDWLWKYCFRTSTDETVVIILILNWMSFFVGHEGIVRLLLQSGANPSIEITNGSNPSISTNQGFIYDFKRNILRTFHFICSI